MLKSILTYIFGIFMVLAGVMHFVNPVVFSGFVPDFLPVNFIIYSSGIIEIALGIGVFIPSFKSKASLGILILMIIFLPLHIIDIFKDEPAIGSKMLAYIRLPLQFVLIYWAWFISKK